MTQDQHIRTDHYVLAREGRIGRATRALHVHRHLVEVCAECAAAWGLLGEGQPAFERLLTESRRDRFGIPPSTPTPPHHRSAYSWEVRRVEWELAEVRRVRSTAVRNGWYLQRRPPEKRPERVERAWSRFRSRAEAEYLLEKARERVVREPRDGDSLAESALLGLQRISGAAGTAWAVELEARIALCRADALRRAGDLDGAEERFALLRRKLIRSPLERPHVPGEVTDGEACLRIAQARFREAHRMLELAHLLGRAADDRALQTRARVRQGRLYAAEGEDLRALRCFREAAAAASRAAGGDPPHRLHLAAVDGQVVALCDLGRCAEAEVLLDAHLELYESWEDLRAGTVVRHHQGRVALGRGRLDEAVRLLREAREGFLEGGRPRRSLLAAADLALVHAARSDDRELAALVRSLALQLRAHRFPHPVRRALRRLVQAVEERAFCAETVAGLRRSLRRQSLSDPVEPPLPTLP